MGQPLLKHGAWVRCLPARCWPPVPPAPPVPLACITRLKATPGCLDSHDTASACIASHDSAAAMNVSSLRRAGRQTDSAVH